jgi:hypothetical protein
MLSILYLRNLVWYHITVILYGMYYYSVHIFRPLWHITVCYVLHHSVFKHVTYSKYIIETPFTNYFNFRFVLSLYPSIGCNKIVWHTPCYWYFLPWKYNDAMLRFPQMTICRQIVNANNVLVALWYLIQ